MGVTPWPVSGIGPYDDFNVFARILRGEIPCRRVYEDEFAIAFHDIAPQAPVHVLVIPAGRYVSLADFTARAADAEIAGFFRAVGAVARQLGLESAATGRSPMWASSAARKCRISTSISSAAGRSGRCLRRGPRRTALAAASAALLLLARCAAPAPPCLPGAGTGDVASLVDRGWHVEIGLDAADLTGGLAVFRADRLSWRAGAGVRLRQADVLHRAHGQFERIPARAGPWPGRDPGDRPLRPTLRRLSRAGHGGHGAAAGWRGADRRVPVGGFRARCVGRPEADRPRPLPRQPVLRRAQRLQPRPHLQHLGRGPCCTRAGCRSAATAWCCPAR